MGSVEENVFREKSARLKKEEETVHESMQQLSDHQPQQGRAALSVLEFSQNAAEIWRGSNNAVRREILETVCLNRTLSDVSLVTTKRKPFDILAKRPNKQNSRDNWHSFEPSSLVGEYTESFLNGTQPHLQAIFRLMRGR